MEKGGHVRGTHRARRRTGSGNIIARRQVTVVHLLLGAPSWGCCAARPARRREVQERLWTSVEPVEGGKVKGKFGLGLSLLRHEGLSLDWYALTKLKLDA